MIKLNIGAGRTPRIEGITHCDLYPGPNVDVVFDACKRWPFKDDAVATVESHHVFEHLPDVWTFMREAWRVLQPSSFCNLTIRLPYGPGLGGIGDITHLRPYLPHSFCCFQPGYNDFVRNPQHDEWDAPFSVMSIYLQINPRLRWMVKPVVRRWGLKALDFLWDGYVEMIVGMRALKTKADVDAWKAIYTADQIPIVPFMYEHNYKGTKHIEGTAPNMKFFGPSAVVLQAQQQRSQK